MPTQARDARLAATMRLYKADFDDSATSLSLQAFVDPLFYQEIVSIQFVYRIAGDTGTHQAHLVGIPADTDKYFSGSASNSKSVGDVETKSITNATYLLPPGTPLCIQRANTSAATNTTEFTILVWMIPVDP